MYLEAGPDFLPCLNMAVVTDEGETVVKLFLERQEQRHYEKYLLRHNFMRYKLAKAT